MRADCHMHTYFSGDSEAKPEDMVLAAIDKGLVYPLHSCRRSR